MNSLPLTTQRRLKKIPQIPSVWEGDRRSLSGINSNFEPDEDAHGECIIWVDGSEGFVRSMDVVSPEMGMEAVVRTLLRAIENPHNPAKPARPQKIVVRDREIQFFLRGALQNLDINIDYVPELPLIDEIFRGFEDMTGTKTSSIGSQAEELLEKVAYEIWDEEPWELLADRDILKIDINRWDIATVYACVMGMLGREYGIILYRSLESLKRFRSVVLSEDSLEELEQAFLAQDCWFLNFEANEEAELDEDEEDIDIAHLSKSSISPIFGSVHVYEGMRLLRDEEEAMAIYVALKGIESFCRAFSEQLAEESIGKLTKNFKISIPGEDNHLEKVNITISTLPELSAELLEMINFDEEDDDDEIEIDNDFEIKDDLIPEESFISLGMMPWDLVAQIKDNKKTYYQSLNLTARGEGMPVILIQTSRPKAKSLIERIQQEQGITKVCLNPGQDRFNDVSYDLGIMQTGNGTLYLFAEYTNDNPQQVKARKQWYNRCQKNNGYCGILIAMGVKGSSRGNPQVKDTIALFEAQAIEAKELGIGTLQLMPDFDFED
jgi:hypothetical protein